MGMNGHEIQPPTQSLPPTQTGSPTQKSFHGGLNNIISKLIDQKKDENTGKGSISSKIICRADIIRKYPVIYYYHVANHQKIRKPPSFCLYDTYFLLQIKINQSRYEIDSDLQSEKINRNIIFGKIFFEKIKILENDPKARKCYH